jgi:hypothetical protein
VNATAWAELTTELQTGAAEVRLGGLVHAVRAPPPPPQPLASCATAMVRSHRARTVLNIVGESTAIAGCEVLAERRAAADR